ncbi:hypothetical protein STHU_12300 [Allostella humosa]|uniref:hypothetical protein n=1 Tax=Stella humosa TaxID=94 RepID=UPI000F4C4B65|nr:hypothetical protein [Stella humosa]BBK30596.1 hypothetical protein STHU_12300 [Stella humosa]
MLFSALAAVAGRVPILAWAMAAAIAAAALWIWVERDAAAGWRHRAAAAEARAALLGTQLDEATAINAGNLAELDRLRRAHARDLADMAADLARSRKAGTRLTVVRQEIARDPDASQPLADRCPAVDRLFDRLLARPGVAADDPDRAGGDAAPGRPAGLPAGATAAAATP